MTKSWKATILTILPEMFPGPLGVSIIGAALDKELWQLETIDIREYASDRHRSVDDTPAGGGPGMVMRADVVAPAVDAALERNPDTPVIYLSPRGKPLAQERVRGLAQVPGVTLLC